MDLGFFSAARKASDEIEQEMAGFTASVKKYDPDDEEEAIGFKTLREAIDWCVSQRCYGYHAAWVSDTKSEKRIGNITESEIANNKLNH